MSYVIYEVNLTIDEDIIEQFKDWLVPHIGHILECDGFLESNVFNHHGEMPPGKVLLTVQYKATDQQALDNYIQDHAPAMRADGIQKFGSKFSATRRILHHSGISIQRK